MEKDRNLLPKDEKKINGGNNNMAKKRNEIAINGDGMIGDGKFPKPSALVQISNNISATQRKAYDALLMIAKEYLKRDVPIDYKFRVEADMILKIIGLGERNHLYLKKFLHELKDINIAYNLLKKDKHKWGEFSLLAGFSYEDGVITYSFPHQILDALINPEIYALIDMIVIKGLRSKYAIALYENLEDYRKVEMPEMPMSELRRLLGVAKDEYKKLSAFKAYVLDQAIKEINNSTRINFTVSYKFKKTGRKYTHIKFILKSRPIDLKIRQQAQKMLEEEIKQSVDAQELIMIIKEESRNKRACINLLLSALREKSKEYVKAQIEYVNAHASTNYCTYLRRAIEEDYASHEVIPLDELIEKPQEVKPKPEDYIKKWLIINNTGYFIQNIKQMEKGYEISLESKTGNKRNVSVKELSELDHFLV